MMQHAPLLASGLLCFALAAPDLMPRSSDPTIEPIASTAAVTEPPAVSAWIERPLFDQSRRPLAGPAAEAAAASPTGSFSERFEIKGIGRADGEVVIIIVETASRKAYRIRPGQQIEDWTFAGEKDGTATFRSGDGTIESLALARLP